VNVHKPNPIDIAAKASGEPVFREVGVGPWSETHPGTPRPDDPSSANYDARFDPVLLDEGDRRNVLDRYRYWSVGAIKADLDAHGRHDFEVAVENWTHDFNIGSMVRTANAFQARRVHIVGPHKWNRKGALMTELYQHVENHPSITELVECWRLRIAGEIAAARSQAAAIAFHMRESAGGVGGVDDAHGVDGVLGVGGADDVQGVGGVGGVGSAYGIGGADGAVGANGIGGVGGTDGVNGADGIQRAGAAGGADAANGIGGGVDGTQGTSVAGAADSVENASGTAGRKAVQLAGLSELDAKIAELEAARVIALDIVPGAVPMETYRFPKRCLMLFGAEGPGLSKKALELADDVVYISQFGSVRSINAGAAAAVSMHAWIAQHAVPQV